MPNIHLRWVYLIVLALIWGSSFILMKKALIGLSPVEVGALRILITAIVLITIGFKGIFTITKKQWFYIFLTAILGTFFPAFLFAFAINGIDSSIASILNSLTPLNTLVMGTFLFSIGFKKHQLFGVLIGLVGTVILILKGAFVNPDQNYWYALLPILASLGYAMNINLLKKHLSGVKPLTITVGNFLFLMPPALVVLWYSGFFNTFEYNKATYPSLVYVTILAILCTAFANTLFNKLVQIASPVFSSSVTYLIPVVGVSWGIIDGEKLSFIQLLSGLIILAGVYLTNRR